MGKTVFSLFVCAFLLFGASGCMGAPATGISVGEVNLVQPGTTMFWLQEAMKGSVGTRIMTDGTNIVISWVSPSKEGISWVAFNARSGEPVKDFLEATCGKAATFCKADWDILWNSMKANGWKIIPAAEAPLWLAQGIAAVSETFTLMVSNFTIFVIPISTFPVSPFDTIDS